LYYICGKLENILLTQLHENEQKQKSYSAFKTFFTSHVKEMMPNEFCWSYIY